MYQKLMMITVLSELSTNSECLTKRKVLAAERRDRPRTSESMSRDEGKDSSSEELLVLLLKRSSAKTHREPKNTRNTSQSKAKPVGGAAVVSPYSAHPSTDALNSGRTISEALCDPGCPIRINKSLHTGVSLNTIAMMLISFSSEDFFHQSKCFDSRESYDFYFILVKRMFEIEVS
jgi:hypothetical protein